ncbi:MAG: ATP-grasp domain-containing protein [Gemmataceae bacterium]|nr:ATP-grasp domain-containing protein [Gemmata sp.]MDW8197408.1 ATP-grasp domain-containing protein [Gemmataceae bacterium]
MVGVVGASARAAVHSLARAGWTAWAVDLFADRDLTRMADCIRCPFEHYPEALPQLACSRPATQILYTGGLENAPDVLQSLSEHHALAATPPEVLRRVRDPFALQTLVADVGLMMPRLVSRGEACPVHGRWLRKPFRSCGGRGIRWANPQEPASASYYFQEFHDGQPLSAVFVNDTLWGVTEQLIGWPPLHAKPFVYCGTIGPLPQPLSHHKLLSKKDLDHLSTSNRLLEEPWAGLERLGQRLAAVGVCGVWGADLLQVDGTLYVLEINPRYTASVEVLEHAYQRAIFSPPGYEPSFSPPGHEPSAPLGNRPAPTPVAGNSSPFEASSSISPDNRSTPTPVIGKAIYYAPHTLIFPEHGPWDADLSGDFDPWRCPQFADIPDAGSRIDAGHPVVSFFVRENSPAKVREQLQSQAVQLDQLFRNYP